MMKTKTTKAIWFGACTTLAVFAGACGGGGTNDGGSNDGGTIDGGSDVQQGETGADVTLAEGGSDGGGVDATADAGPACTLRRALIGTSDFATAGGFATGDVTARTFVESSPSTSVDQDHVVRSTGCLTFDLQRSVGAVRVIDPGAPGTALRTITIPGVAGTDGGTSSADPTDIVVVSPTKAYVTLYNSAQIAIVNPTAGTVTGMIDGSAFADADGLPEFAWILSAGGKVYVGAQQLDRPNFYTAPAHSHVAVIDPATDAFVDMDAAMAGVQGIELSYGDPTSATLTDDGASLLVAGGGFASPTAGGVDVIELSTGHVVRSVTATSLGGTPSGIVDALGPLAWAGVEIANGDAGTSHAIVQFDYMTGVVRSAPIATPTFPVSDLKRAPDGAIWVIGTAYDASFMPTGYADVYSTNGTTLTVAPFMPTGNLAMTSLDFTP